LAEGQLESIGAAQDSCRTKAGFGKHGPALAAPAPWRDHYKTVRVTNRVSSLKWNRRSVLAVGYLFVSSLRFIKIGFSPEHRRD
jgi:hypothetical protein